MIWDLFCRVIDNYGDIGVTWRLARQLACEHGIVVRLWVDELAAFQRLEPGIDPRAPRQTLAGVDIRHWQEPLPEVTPGEVVIEALACDTPADFVTRMAAMTPPPLWINLEYLSAEDWVAGVHGLPSPHPRLPLTKYFFMPGYDRHTGGLTREAGLIFARDAWQAAADTQRAFWSRFHAGTDDDALRVSLFCYDNAALPGLLRAWAGGERRIEVVAPRGRPTLTIARALGLAEAPPAGQMLTRGALCMALPEMLALDDYDRLLWTCDVNFVRGEDSFTRAQFAARPMVWQAYPQAEGAHFAKLEAFLQRYSLACCDAAAATANAELWRAWNREGDVAGIWSRFLAVRATLAHHARDWAAHLAAQPDLATNLLNFHRERLKSQVF